MDFKLDNLETGNENFLFLFFMEEGKTDYLPLFF